MTPDSKEKFHRTYKRVLRDLAKDLGLKASEFDVRSNKAGPAILGEVTLHTDRIYFQVGGSLVDPDETLKDSPYWILYRTCKGRKDYVGGVNQFMGLHRLDAEHRAWLLNVLRPMAKEEK